MQQILALARNVKPEALSDGALPGWAKLLVHCILDKLRGSFVILPILVEAHSDNFNGRLPISIGMSEYYQAMGTKYTQRKIEKGL